LLKAAAAVGGLATFLTLPEAAENRMLREAFNSHAPLYKMPRLASIILPTLNEEKNIHVALTSLAGQNVRVAHPERFELIVVDSRSADRTAEIAGRYADRVYTAPRGKLTARDLGVKAAKGEVVVAVDADTYYPPNFLNLLLRHFQRPEVVAVAGARTYPSYPHRYFSAWSNLLGICRLNGQSSAFRRDAYFKTGGFNLAVNQFYGPNIQQEEEFNFYAKLSRFGKVVFDRKAAAITSDRRFTDREFQEQIASGVRFKQRKN